MDGKRPPERPRAVGSQPQEAQSQAGVESFHSHGQSAREAQSQAGVESVHLRGLESWAGTAREGTGEAKAQDFDFMLYFLYVCR